jgi:hypothetical protein
MAGPARTEEGVEFEVEFEFDDTTLRAALARHRVAICAGTVVITNWRVGKVTDMSGLFRWWDTLNQRLQWDVSRVTNMRAMFQGCSAFNQPLRDGTGRGEWDVSRVASMSLMFEGCGAFNQGIRWGSERCTNFRAMFMECASLTCTIELDVRAVQSSKWLDNMLAFAGPGDVAIGPRLVLRHAPDGTLETDVHLALRRTTPGIVLLSEIGGGASRRRVWKATVRGAPSVCKLVSEAEAAVLKSAQGPGVVSMLANAQSMGALRLVAMERLSPLVLHPTYGPDGPIDTRYLLQRRTESGRGLVAHGISRVVGTQLTQLLSAVRALNASGVMWWDLKQENVGISSGGSVKIFDFGESRAADETNKHRDVLVYGALVYNTIAQEYAFAPGRHYDDHRDQFSKDELVATVGLLSGLSDGISGALRACFGLGDESSDADVAAATSLLLAALTRGFRVNRRS